ncbi:MAG: MmgE/PrpD family protein [Deltaproteobacteria bacterium]|nr:MmgE/PrpD family protein [Deltaproteobacteria bacterium]
MDAIARYLSGYAASLDYRDLPRDTVHEARRRILDSVGCALGGFAAEPCRIARDLAPALEGRGTARILGTGQSTTPDMAAFANTAMIRYLDCNDSFVSPGGGHPSDMLPAVLAAAEVAGASGRAVITALVLAYEIYGQFAARFATREKGWDQGLFIGPASACAAGKVLGLPEEQLAHAMAMTVVSQVPLGQTRVGELSAWKGCATAMAARNGVFAALLARAGMEGPPEPFEGRYGLFEQVTGELPLDGFGDANAGVPFKLAETSIKYFPVQIHTQAGAAMALELRDEFDPDQLERIRIETYGVAVRNAAGEPEKWDPKTRETADHSLPYVVAVALTDGGVTPASFDEKRIGDPLLRPLMRKIEVSEDPEATRNYPAQQQARMEVELRSGRRLTRAADYPKGHSRNPLSDSELEQKFLGLTAGVLPRARQAALLESLRRFDELENMDALFKTCQVV